MTNLEKRIYQILDNTAEAIEEHVKQLGTAITETAWIASKLDPLESMDEIIDRCEQHVMERLHEVILADLAEKE